MRRILICTAATIASLTVGTAAHAQTTTPDDTTSASEVADSVVSEVSQVASNAADTASNAAQDVTDNDDDDSDKTGLWGLAGLLGLLGLLGLKRRKDAYTSSRPVGADQTPRGSTSGHD